MIASSVFKRMDEKLLTSYILKNLISDLKEDQLKADIHDSFLYLTGLDVTNHVFEKYK